ncbi:MAG: HD domain-containing protein [Treponema sp.]|nr:HD domain-containing protein [Treponema sp.]
MACCIYYLETNVRKVNPRHIVLFIFTNIANYCFALGAFSDNLEGLYVSFQLYYFGCIFTDITLLLLIIELCGYKTNIFIRLILFVYGAFIVYLIANVKHSNLYYTSMNFVQKYGMSYMTRTYGPLHNLLLFLIIGVTSISIVYIIIALKTKKDIALRTVRILLSMFFIGTLLYFLPKIIHVGLDFMPFFYTVMNIVALIIFKRAELYDISSNILNVYEQRSEYGYIAFDIHKRFLGSNEYAKNLFPFLRGYRIDKKFTNNSLDNSYFKEELIPWTDSWINGNQQPKLFTQDNVTNELSMRNIQRNKQIIGYLIVIKDVTQHQKYLNLINNYNSNLQEEINKKTKKLFEIQESIIKGMAAMVESRDNSTGGHINRTSAGVKVFVDKLQYSEKYKLLGEKFCENLIKAAPMHDLGKIAVRDDVLKKPGKFTPEEYENMKIHPAEGARIVAQVLANVDDEEFKQIAINVAHYHHEKWNGTGYPKGLKGEEIPIEARIMAFADVFDALVSKRCYKDAYNFDRAFEIIQNDLGSHFDPDLGPIFLSCKQELIDLYNNMELKY